MLRNNDELSLKLVLPLEERKYLRDLEDLVIIAPNGENLPLDQVAELKYGQSFSAIRRINGRRIVSVRALVDSEVTNTAEVVMSLKNSLLPETIMQNPELQTGKIDKMQNCITGPAAVCTFYVLHARNLGRPCVEA